MRLYFIAMFVNVIAKHYKIVVYFLQDVVAFACRYAGHRISTTTTLFDENRIENKQS